MSSSSKVFNYRRPALAAKYCDSMAGDSLADTRSGLFLSAKRRVGKSTFLKQDLIPEAVARGWHPIYVDLWSDRSKDPAILIADAIRVSLQEKQNLFAKMTQTIGLSQIKIAGVGIDLNTKQGLPQSVTLSDALITLQKMVKTPIVMLVDEAQHALTSEAGVNAMFGLKAARDAMNTGEDKPNLMLVFTGSMRDKLAHLVMTSKQPFYGSSVTDFPMLDKDFTDHYTAHINTGLAEDNQFDPDAVWTAFQRVGQRPEFLRRIISDVALEAQDAPNLNEMIKSGAELVQGRLWKEIESEFTSLSGLQQSIVRVMADQRGEFSPFGANALASYARYGAVDATTSTVQTALKSLRERGIVWQEARGAYELEDETWITWLSETYDPTKQNTAPAAPAEPISEWRTSIGMTTRHQSIQNELLALREASYKAALTNPSLKSAIITLPVSEVVKDSPIGKLHIFAADRALYARIDSSTDIEPLIPAENLQWDCISAKDGLPNIDNPTTSALKASPLGHDVVHAARHLIENRLAQLKDNNLIVEPVITRDIGIRLSRGEPAAMAVFASQKQSEPVLMLGRSLADESTSYVSTPVEIKPLASSDVMILLEANQHLPEYEGEEGRFYHAVTEPDTGARILLAKAEEKLIKAALAPALERSRNNESGNEM